MGPWVMAGRAEPWQAVHLNHGLLLLTRVRIGTRAVRGKGIYYVLLLCARQKKKWMVTMRYWNWNIVQGTDAVVRSKVLVDLLSR